jgi:arsenate reductase-like glutaredoxin family protein
MADVTIYTRMMCGYCAAAKRLLESKGVAYTEHDASFSPEAGRFRRSLSVMCMSAVRTTSMRWTRRASSTRCCPTPK